MAKKRTYASEAAKPRIFVGSSSEAKDQAQGFCDTLQDDANLIPWWQAPEFKVGFATLENLADAAESYDFAIFVLTPDDNIESRGQKGHSARDNVLFELGLFLGAIGRERVFAFIQNEASSGRKVKIPSDLQGITFPRFSGEAGLTASVNTAVNRVRPNVRSLGPRQRHFQLVTRWGYEPNRKTFHMRLGAGLIERNRVKLRGNKLLMVVRRRDENADFQDDRNIALCGPREISDLSKTDVVLRAKRPQALRRSKPGDFLDGHLILIPSTVEVRGVQTIRQILRLGGRMLESLGQAIN